MFKKSKIREIIINCASGGESAPKPRTTVYHFDEDSFDKLEKELQKLMTKAVNRAFKNAEKKLYAKTNRDGMQTE